MRFLSRRMSACFSRLSLLAVPLLLGLPADAQPYTVLHEFTFAGGDGSSPQTLVQGRDGNFYGTTSSEGTSGNGAVFKITPTGTLTTLHSFAGSDGSDPQAGLVQGTDGNFYGTTSYGGTGGNGTVFR